MWIIILFVLLLILFDFLLFYVREKVRAKAWKKELDNNKRNMI